MMKMTSPITCGSMRIEPRRLISASMACGGSDSKSLARSLGSRGRAPGPDDLSKRRVMDVGGLALPAGLPAALGAALLWPACGSSLLIREPGVSQSEEGVSRKRKVIHKLVLRCA